jgi:aspartyl protease family protein
VPGNTVRLGDITLHEVDVTVNETNMPWVLLGMSFLNRLEMRREGDTMTLKKRY